MQLPAIKKKLDDTSIVKRKIRRGFEVTGLGVAARKRLKLIDSSGDASCASTAEYAKRWSTIYDVFDDLPAMAPPSDEVPGGRWLKPYHLDPYIQALQRCIEDQFEMAFSAPPGHFKTVSLFLAFVFLLVKFPGHRHIYITYNGDQAATKHAEFVRILDALRIKHETHSIITRCNGGSVQFFGKGAGAQGKHCDGLMVVDDPIADKGEARSPGQRESLWQKLVGDIMTREAIGGMSTLVMMTRYDPDDIVGRLSKLRKKDPANPGEEIKAWPLINIPVYSLGEAVDPLQRPEGEILLEVLRNKVEKAELADPFNFGAMYMGIPINKGARLFSEPKTYSSKQGFGEASHSTLPAADSYSVGGIDVGYSGHGDWSVAVFGRQFDDGRIFITKVIREQTTPGEFAKSLVRAQTLRMSPIMWLIAAQEAYTGGKVLRDAGVKRLQFKQYERGKGAREQPVADAWNSGQILVPERQDEQMQQFIEEVLNFTGNPKQHDDCVAALDGMFRLCKRSDGRLHAPHPVAEEKPKMFESMGMEQRMRDWAASKRRLAGSGSHLVKRPLNTRLFSN